MALNAYVSLFQLFASYLLFSGSVLTRETCYWPNGSLAEDDYEACHSGDSVCCYEGDVCLSNNLCYGAQYGVPYRGACTVKDWVTEACPTQYCNSAAVAISSGSAILIACEGAHNVAASQSWWCGINEACQTGDGSYLGPWASAVAENIASVHDSKRPMTASSSQLSAIASPNSTTLTNRIISTGSAPASTPASITPTTVGERNHEKSSNLTPIGLGLGLSLGIALLGLLGFHVWKVQRWRALNSTMQERLVEIERPELAANGASSDRECQEIDGHIGVPEMADQTGFRRYEL